MELVLRGARPGDVSEVADVFLLSRAEAMAFLPARHDDDEIRAWIGDVVLPEQEVVVAEAEGRLAGFAALDGNVLAHLYVRPDVQGCGVGTALLARAMQLRPDGFSLWVFQRNTRARRFYERRGLRLLEVTDGTGNEEQEPDARYEWRPG